MGRLCRAVTSQIQSVSALTRVTRGSFALNSPAGAALTLVMRTLFLCCVVSIGRFMTSCVEKVSSGDHTTTEAEWLPLTSLDDEVAFTVLASLYFISVALNSLSHTHTHTHIHH